MTENKYDGVMVGYNSGVDASCYCTGQCVGLGYCPATRDTVQRIETPSEKAYRLGVKVYEDEAKDWSPQNPNPIIGVCGRCGMEVRLNNNTTICSEIRCPADLGPKMLNY